MFDLASIIRAIRRFAADESGAVTVDWVVGTAAAISVTIAMTGQVKTAVITLADSISGRISAIQITTDFSALNTPPPSTTSTSYGGDRHRD